MSRRALFFTLSLSVASGAALVACGGGDDAAPVAAPTPGPTPAPSPSPSPTPPPVTPPGGSPTPAPTILRQHRLRRRRRHHRHRHRRRLRRSFRTLTRTVVATGLSSPWDLAFLPDGSMLFTEKCRGLSRRAASGAVTRLFGDGRFVAGRERPVLRRAKRRTRSRAIDPDFANNRYVYLFMASNLSPNPRTNRVVRIQLDAAFATASNRVDIVTDIAYKHVGNAVGGAGAHSGGRIRFGPDGYLYVTSGDNHNSSLPQDLTRLGGKVMRVDRNGAAAPGNNTTAAVATHASTPTVTAMCRGSTSGQATVNLYRRTRTEPQRRSHATGCRWQRRLGPTEPAQPDCPDNYCGYAGNPTTMPMTDTVRFPSAMRPAWVLNTGARGMGPLAFLRGTQWKAWDGRLAVSIMAAENLRILVLDAGGTATSDATAPCLQAACARWCRARTAVCMSSRTAARSGALRRADRHAPTSRGFSRNSDRDSKRPAEAAGRHRVTDGAAAPCSTSIRPSANARTTSVSARTPTSGNLARQ